MGASLSSEETDTLVKRITSEILTGVNLTFTNKIAGEANCNLEQPRTNENASVSR